ncbi:hypothetical protein LCGC14_2145800 [marine sediment metagenome]|uniref:Uncharacterized protein n=1 Tax=marine sediment metagenome TaxID=412755 RepID=A0A0F9GTD5_9ZZZZ
MEQQPEIITQLYECCHEWIDPESLVWDLEEDRLVCGECYSGKD